MDQKPTQLDIEVIKTMIQSGTTLTKIANAMSTSVAQIDQLITRLNLEKPADVRRRLREEAKPIGPSERKLAIELRNDEIVERLYAGAEVTALAKEFGLSRETIHKMRRELELPSSSQMKRDETDKVIGEISDWVRSHPGCTPAEISEFIEIAENEVEALIDRSVKHLVLGVNVKSQTSILSTKWTQDQTFLALQKAANRLSPLTRENYDNFRHEGVVSGPSGIRIIQIYGKWSKACELAGVESGAAVRANYKRNLTREEMSEYLGEYLITCTTASADAYDAWARKEVGAPSLGTLRNEFGKWNEACDEALRQLRYMWEEQEI